jgi:hypothetical protein
LKGVKKMAIRKRDGVEAADRKLLLDKMNQTARKVGLGSLIDGQKGIVKAKYDFSVLGGAVGSVNLRDPEDSTKTVTLPNKAVITTAYIDILTAMASAGGTGTIALTAQSAGDLKAAVDADTLSGIVACIPTGSAASSIKLTAERTLTATIATEALTAGKFILVVEYFVTE